MGNIIELRKTIFKICCMALSLAVYTACQHMPKENGIVKSNNTLIDMLTCNVVSLQDEFLSNFKHREYILNEKGELYNIQSNYIKNNAQLVDKSVKKIFLSKRDITLYLKKNGDLYILGNKKSISKNVIDVSIMDKNTVYYITNNKICFQYNVKTKKVKIVKKDAQRVFAVQTVGNDGDDNIYKSIFIIDKDSNLWSKGSNVCGRLGISRKSKSCRDFCFVLSNVKDLYFREKGYTIYAKTQNDSIWLWGLNGFEIENLKDYTIYKPIELLKNIKQFNLDTAQFLDKQNNLWAAKPYGAFFYDDKLYCGNGDDDKTFSVLEKIGSDVKCFGMNYYIDINDNLFCWGDYPGNGKKISLKPVKVLNNVYKVVIQKNYSRNSVALTKNGELYFWGKNDEELFFENNVVPKPKLVGTNIIDIQENLLLNYTGDLFIWNKKQDKYGKKIFEDVYEFRWYYQNVQDSMDFNFGNGGIVTNDKHMYILRTKDNDYYEDPIVDKNAVILKSN